MSCTAFLVYSIYTSAPGNFKALGQLGAPPVMPTTGIWLRALSFKTSTDYPSM